MADEGVEQWRLAVDFLDVSGDNIDGTANEEDEILHETRASQLETGGSSNNVGQVVEEETVELEFEKVKPKLATHSMHCPNCKSEITKVILRRKVFLHRPTEPEPEQKDFDRCFSCLSLFTCSEDPQLLEPLYVNRQSIISSNQVQAPKYVTGNDLKLKDPEQLEPLYVNRQSIISSHQVQAPKYITETTSINQGTYHILSSGIPESSNAREDDDTTIIIKNKLELVPLARSRGRSCLGYEGILAEILKSIVYGGLMEVIVSLSVVVSAAASNGTTLNIVSLALGSLIGRVFIIGHNLWDLTEDCYKNKPDKEVNKATTNKYKELLGQVYHFPLHAFFAILSFLVFGMVPPVAYRYSYHETKDKDFTLVVVATTSLICVMLLAVIKAYINKCTVFEYFKTVVYCIIIAVLVSSVSYVVGNLVARLLEDLEWFNRSSGGGKPCLPRVTNPYLESF